MLKFIQEIIISLIFGALGASLFIYFYFNHQSPPIIGIIDSLAIIEGIKQQQVKSILNHTGENPDNLKETTRRINAIMAEFERNGITLIEKKAVVSEGRIHDYTEEIQRRLGQ